jgi:hypothetical protein
VRVWAFVVNFLLHGPSSYEKKLAALQLVLDLSLDCDMMCHPKKLIPPQHVVQYCGFSLDSTHVISLVYIFRLPSVDHLLESSPHREFSPLNFVLWGSCSPMWLPHLCRLVILVSTGLTPWSAPTPLV